jgi:hypothetical protein
LPRRVRATTARAHIELVFHCLIADQTAME